MRNKSKIKHIAEQRIFIGNDLTLQKRNLQQNQTGGGEGKNGKEVRIGLIKLQIDKVWRRWNA